jgi:hypothetical protein
MEKWTKENPGCYHGMIKYLAEINNTLQITIDKVMTLRELYSKPDAKKAKHRGLKYNSYDISVIDMNGVAHPYIKEGKRFDQHGIIPQFFMCQRPKNIREFDIQPTKIGKYKDSLGGGWYQSVDLYQINDKFFALIDCTC